MIKDFLPTAMSLEFVQEAKPYVEPESASLSENTCSTLVSNADGSFTYTDPDGTVTTISAVWPVPEQTHYGAHIPNNPNIGDSCIDENGAFVVYSGNSWVAIE